MPLVAELHLIQLNAKTSVEKLGRRKFEAHWGVDFQTAMAEYNRAYEAMR